ncbi:MAG TPA: hypothetical protein VMW91_01095 [Desulfosporosinus sp.]|nr:hypothetical protein [Desulfosporosinus sp.]
MVTFPGGIYSHVTLLDNTDDVLASHPNTLGEEIEAIEAKIGINASAVATAIDYFLKNASGAYRTHTHDGTSDDGPNIPVDNLANVVIASLTDGDFLIYDGANWNNGPLVLENRSGSDPAAPVTGQMWFRTDV